MHHDEDAVHRHVRATGSGSAAVDETFRAVADSVRSARHAVARWLRTLSADPILVDDVNLAVSEACTNVVMHGYRNGAEGWFRVVADAVGGGIRVTIMDAGCGVTPRPDSPGAGFGMPLMATLADSLEVGAGPGGRGTVVSMLFAAPGPGTTGT